MPVNLDDLTKPANADPVGSPDNGIQAEMRAVKTRLKNLNDKLILTGAFPVIAATFYNATSASNSPVVITSSTNVENIQYFNGIYLVESLIDLPSANIIAFNAGILELNSLINLENQRVQQARIGGLNAASFQMYFFQTTLDEGGTTPLYRAATVNTPGWFSLQVRPGA